MTDDDWVRRVHEANDDSDLVALIDDLRATRNALSALGRLAHDRDPVIRAWVADHGPEVAGDDSVPLLWGLVEDADPDVRDVALGALESADPRGRDRIEANLRRQALTADRNDFHGPQVAIWRLVRMGATDLEGLLNQVESHPVWPWHRAVAVAARLVISHDDGRLASLIGDPSVHDHDLTPSLAVAAQQMPTPRVIDALRRCNAGDELADCRRECGQALAMIEDAVAP